MSEVVKATSRNLLVNSFNVSGEDSDEVINRLKDDQEIYEFVFECSKVGFDKAKMRLSSPYKLPFDFLTSGTDLYDLYRDIEYAKIEIDIDTNKGQIIEDSYPCKRCGCKKVYMVSRQLRRADEPETHLFTCTNCYFHWRIG